MFKCYWYVGENICINVIGDEYGGCIRGIGYFRFSFVIFYIIDKCLFCK